MSRLKNFFDFGSDLLLLAFLFTLFGVVFIGALGFTPKGADFSQSQNILGTNTTTSNKFSVLPDTANDGTFSLAVLEQKDTAIKLQYKVAKVDSGSVSWKIADLSNDTDAARKIYLSLDTAEKFLAGMRYDLIIHGVNYPVYDDSGEKLMREYEVSVAPHQSVEVVLKLTAYENVAYPLDGVVNFNGISNLP
jgi:hypothetical protein